MMENAQVRKIPSVVRKASGEISIPVTCKLKTEWQEGASHIGKRTFRQRDALRFLWPWGEGVSCQRLGTWLEWYWRNCVMWKERGGTGSRWWQRKEACLLQFRSLEFSLWAVGTARKTVGGRERVSQCEFEEEYHMAVLWRNTFKPQWRPDWRARVRGMWKEEVSELLDMGTEGIPGVWLGPWMQRWRCSPLRQEALVKSRCMGHWGFWTGPKPTYP